MGSKSFFLGLFLSCLIFGVASAWQEFQPSWEDVEEIQNNHPDTLRPYPSPPPSFPDFVSAPIKELHDTFFRSLFQMLLQRGIYHNEGNRSISPFNFKRPEELDEILDLRLGDEGMDQEKLLGIIGNILEYSPRPGHPFNLHRRNNGLDPHGLAADWIVTAMSTPLVVYLVAPVFTLTEMELLKEFRRMIGYPAGEKHGEYGDGIGNPMPNSLALEMALGNTFPDPDLKKTPNSTLRGYKQHGLVGIGSPQPVIFISEDADLDWEKTGAMQGIGIDEIVRVRTDARGRMDLGALKTAISNARKFNKTPSMIVGTAGTPILGAIDPLNEIAEIAKLENIWFHVDATCGGSLLFSDAKSQKLSGIEKSDSVSWSAHCLMGAPAETGVFVTRHEDSCKTHFGIIDAAYVFNTTLINKDKWNIGDNTIQTCRRSFTFDIWYMWKAKGTQGFGSHIDHLYSLSNSLIETIKRRPKLRLILPEFDLPQVSFYYEIPQTKGKNPKTPEYVINNSNATLTIKNQLLLGGIAQLSTTPSGSLFTPTYFTLKLSNSALTSTDLTYILDQIISCGDDLFQKGLPSCGKLTIPPPPATSPTWVSSPIQKLHGAFHQKVANLILDDGLYFQNHRDQPPIKYVHPEDMNNLINLNLTAQGTDDEELFDILAKTIEFSPHQSHPFWIYQLSAGLDPWTIAGDLIQGVVSTPSLTYEDNPAFALIEKELSRAVLAQLNWPNGDVLYPQGGTFANVYGINFARAWRNMRLKKGGYSGNEKSMRVYISNECHYSLTKGTFFLGLGRENAVYIPSGRNGRMNVTSLRRIIEKDLADGKEPLMIAATAGTTILGAIDPLEELADLCQEFNLYFHVDGAFGGPMFMGKNPSVKDRLKGLERADSFSFNPAKMFGATQLMNVLAVRDGRLPGIAQGLRDPVDFEGSGLYSSKDWDEGDKYLVKDRRSTAVKMWLMWKAKGLNGISKHLDYITNTVKYCVSEMKRLPGFESYLDEYEATNVLFMYVPERLRGMNRRTKEFHEGMEKVAFDMQSRLVAEGVMVVVAQRHAKSPLHLKLVLMSSALSQNDLKFFFDEVARIGEMESK